MVLLNGKELAQQRFLHLKTQVSSLVKKPKLAGILIGKDFASQIYVSKKKEACEKLGFTCDILYLGEDSTQKQVLQLIEKLNKDNTVTGILLQLPIPKHLNALGLINAISSKKDVDGVSAKNMGLLLQKAHTIAPCTAQGICNLLKAYNFSIKGAHVVIVGRSLIVGLPTSILLQQQGATVSLCHSQTSDLKHLVQQADIVVVSVGKKHLLDKTAFKKNAVVIDVGISREGDKLYGDVCPQGLENVLKAYSPVPGGVGPMTIQTLMENLVKLQQLADH
ncbi:MAG: bifunctional 5,10-methylenetetrahydrofolate dehydrogenase/5,10-methenyltetrahydrofolate cyclohydrolase [Bdellovibrionaceae bacterium]|nr:bifunctional 5,10-methylenetetrahydrofolate dehydrogenase/5,10-methenyltetrahydrofolate cyclohydrolase [Pseudobdellovibrionaceae bacterium]